jgi:hypothetical protein
VLKLRRKPHLHRRAQTVGTESSHSVGGAPERSAPHGRRDTLWWILLAVLIVL